MSLELALEKNTATMERLIAALGTQAANITRISAEAKPIGDTTPVKATKAEPEAKKPAAASPPPETAVALPASKPEVSISAAAVTYDDVKALVLQVSKDKGRDAAAAVLSGFGVAKAPELKPEQYVDAVAQLKAALA